MTKRRFGSIMILLYAVVFQSYGQCLTIYGRVSDIATALSNEKVTIQLMSGRKKTSTCETTADGQYQVSLPCTTTSVIIEATGYRTFTLPVELSGSVHEGAYFVPMLLTSIDKQASDSPYFQTEQTHYELKSSTKTVSKLKSTRIFKIVDALNQKKSLDAELCLFYTKTGKKNCVTLNKQQPDYTISFTEADIVALEVTSPGYEAYNGNLILEELDGQTKIYTVLLSKEQTIFSLVSPPDLTYLLTTPSSTQKLLSADKTHHYLITTPGNYVLKSLNKAGVLLSSKEIVLKKGLNTYFVPPAQPVSPAPPPFKTAPASSQKMSATLSVYFDQSSYVLRKDTKDKLDSLGYLLVQNPDQKVQINGHTDNVGNSNLNATLGEYRARVVLNYLSGKGVSEKQLSWRSDGGKNPVATNDTEENKIKNRRVEIIPIN